MPVVLHGLALWPLVHILWDLAWGRFLVDPVREIITRTGRVSLNLLVLSLACTPLYTLTGFAPLVRARRTVGLYAFLYVALHFLTFAGWDYGFDLRLLWEAVFYQRYVIVGSAAGLILLALAITSTRGWQRRLGKGWKRLQRLVYVANVLAVLHFVWLLKEPRAALPYAVVVGVLLGLRVPAMTKIIQGKRSGRSENPQSLLTFIGLFLAVLLLTCCTGDAEPLISQDYTTLSVTVTSSAFDVTEGNSFAANQALWSHDHLPASHEVVLFRRAFTLARQLNSAELFIFADTRYEVWVDGEWIGRGPARFSQTTREYDVHQLGALSPGQHLVAVLVQWAPNNRRSESVSPFLMAHIQGSQEQNSTVVIRTDSDWKALSADAWKQDATPVHSWGLIGPTELVDLHQLPYNWMCLKFDDRQWPRAIVKDVSAAVVYRPRSIPLLADVPFIPTILDAGLLSPGRVVAELPVSLPDPYILTLEATEINEFHIEAITGTLQAILFDNDSVNWQATGEYRPDVYGASVAIQPGLHTLSFSSIPPQGLTLSISTQGINLGKVPFQQGVHAGRRLLLAEPVQQPNVIRILPGIELSMEFVALPAYVVLDLGRVIHGRFRVEVDGPSGAIVDIGWDERLLSGTQRPLPYPGSRHSEWNQVDSWILDGTSRTITTFNVIKLRPSDYNRVLCPPSKI